MDAACREHDIAYSRCKDLTKRHVADKLVEEAWKRITAKDSTFGERSCHSCLGDYGSQTENWAWKRRRKKPTKKRILAVAKRAGIYSTAIRSLRVGQRRDRSRKSYKHIIKPYNVIWKNWNVITASWKVMEFISIQAFSVVTRLQQLAKRMRILYLFRHIFMRTILPIGG